MARHLTVLDTLRCTVCGACAGAPCDRVAHQVWGVATFACSYCGAKAGEPCDADCDPDRLMTFVLEDLLST